MRRRLRRFGRRLSVRVDLAEGEVPEHHLEGGAVPQQTTDIAHRRGRVRAFEVTVDHQLVPAGHATGMVGGVDRS